MRVHSSPILSFGLRRQREPPPNDGRAIPVSLYGNGAENVRSDKDSEPETYGEGIKKEIQYRRTLPTDQPFFRPSGDRSTGRFDSGHRFHGDKGGFFWTRRGATLVAGEKPVATGRFFRWTICRLGYSEGAAMAVGSASLHIGI